MDIYLETHESCNLEVMRMWKKNDVKVGSDRVFVVLGVRVRVLTLINDCHSVANFA